MQVEDVAYLGRAGILLRHPRRIGFRRPELLPDLLRRVQDTDGVAPALRHLRFPIETENALGLSEERLRLGKQRLPTTIRRVPPTHRLSRELEMLHLVVADGDQIG